MELTQIKYEQVGQVAWIKLYRPENLNTLTQVMISELLYVMTKLNQDENCRIIVVKGSGKSWSAGVDLAVFQEISIAPGNKMYEEGIEIIRMLENGPQVTIAMLNGYCFGGAMELLLAFDLIVAAEEAAIGDAHAKWGIPPKWGMTQRLQAQVGLRKAKELSFTCQPISGKEAERIGLVNQAVPMSELQATTDSLIEKLLENSPQAIAAMKEIYQYGSIHTQAEGLEFEKAYKMDLTDKMETLKNFKNNI